MLTGEEVECRLFLLLEGVPLGTLRIDPHGVHNQLKLPLMVLDHALEVEAGFGTGVMGTPPKLMAHLFGKVWCHDDVMFDELFCMCEESHFIFTSMSVVVRVSGR